MFPKVTPKDTKAWQQLQQHYDSEIKGMHMRSVIQGRSAAIFPVFPEAGRYPLRFFEEYR
jgi:hypothetical protein